MNEEKRKRLAELDRLAREQDERAAEREQRYLAELHALLDQATLRDAERVSAAVVGQYGLLEERLRALDLIGADDLPTYRSAVVPATGEVIVGIEVNGLTYAFGGAGAGDVLIVGRNHGGRRQHATLDEHGQPIQWHDAPPRPADAAQN